MCSQNDDPSMHDKPRGGMEVTDGIVTVDITPTWEAILPLLLHGMRARGRNAAQRRADSEAELLRMARAADKWNAQVNPPIQCSSFHGENAWGPCVFCGLKLEQHPTDDLSQMSAKDMYDLALGDPESYR